MLSHFGRSPVWGDGAKLPSAACGVKSPHPHQKSTSFIEKWLKENKNKFDADELKLRSEYQDIMSNIGTLDENIQRIVNDAVGDEMEAARAKLYDYYIVYNNGALWLSADGGDLTFKANGHIKLFSSLWVDGKLVDPSNYTVSSGSTIATLKQSYLDKLSDGEHSISFVYNDGAAYGRFYVNERINRPVTGDSANLGLWTALLLLSAAGMTALIPAKKRYTGKSK